MSKINEFTTKSTHVQSKNDFGHMLLSTNNTAKNPVKNQFAQYFSN